MTNHLQGIQNEIALIPNMPAVAGLGALQQQMNANHLQVMALLGQCKARLDRFRTSVSLPISVCPASMTYISTRR